MVKNYIPKRGDIIHLNFNPSIGHEQKDNRYAVVVSHYIFNKRTKMCYACPITSKYKGYPSQIEIQDENIKGAVLIDQLKSIDYQAREVIFEQKLSDKCLENILDIIEAIIFDEE